MKTVALEELDPATRQWLREVSQHEQVIVTENGVPILLLTFTPPPPHVAAPID